MKFRHLSSLLTNIAIAVGIGFMAQESSDAGRHLMEQVGIVACGIALMAVNNMFWSDSATMFDRSLIGPED